MSEVHGERSNRIIQFLVSTQSRIKCALRLLNQLIMKVSDNSEINTIPIDPFSDLLKDLDSVAHELYFSPLKEIQESAVGANCFPFSIVQSMTLAAYLHCKVMAQTDENVLPETKNQLDALESVLEELIFPERSDTGDWSFVEKLITTPIELPEREALVGRLRGQVTYYLPWSTLSMVLVDSDDVESPIKWSRIVVHWNERILSQTLEMGNMKPDRAMNTHYKSTVEALNVQLKAFALIKEHQSSDHLLLNSFVIDYIDGGGGGRAAAFDPNLPNASMSMDMIDSSNGIGGGAAMLKIDTMKTMTSPAGKDSSKQIQALNEKIFDLEEEMRTLRSVDKEKSPVDRENNLELENRLTEYQKSLSILRDSEAQLKAKLQKTTESLEDSTTKLDELTAERASIKEKLSRAEIPGGTATLWQLNNDLRNTVRMLNSKWREACTKNSEDLLSSLPSLGKVTSTSENRNNLGVGRKRLMMERLKRLDAALSGNLNGDCLAESRSEKQ
eukprot:GHVH01000583.1.p1 GENE.GHVH01000583.1~~GHVH01000583.1.p1  ORF type:complete len:501 (+),score=71.79 GHVH01000583.1:112-1614(+)